VFPQRCHVCPQHFSLRILGISSCQFVSVIFHNVCYHLTSLLTAFCFALPHECFDWSVLLFDVSSSFVRAYVWFIVFIDMSAHRFTQSFARTIHSQKAHYLSRVSLEDRQVNFWRSERLFAFNDHNHTFSISTSFDSVTCACAAGIVWENRF